MTYLEFCFCIEKVSGDENHLRPYDFWSVDNEGMFWYMTPRDGKDFISGCKDGIASRCQMDFINVSAYELPLFIPFEDLEPYLSIELILECKPDYDYAYCNPAVSVCGKLGNGSRICRYSYVRMIDFFDVLSEALRMIEDDLNLDIVVSAAGYYADGELAVPLALLVQGRTITIVEETEEIFKKYAGIEEEAEE